MIKVGDCFQWVIEVSCQQSSNNTQAYETHAYEESRLQCLTEFHANTQADDGKDDWHHHTRTQANDIAKYLFHFNF